MRIEELHERIEKAPPPPYDERLSGFMDARGYKDYEHNRGHTYYLYLAKLVRELRPHLAVELGTDIGRSAAFMMTQLGPDSKFVTVEIGTQIRTDLSLFSGDPRLEIVVGSSTEPRVYQPIRNVDFLFIDTDHTYEQVSAEWKIWVPRLSPGAIVAADDIHLNPGMEKWWNELACPKVDCGREIHISGWGIVQPD